MPLADLMRVYSFTCHLLIKMLTGRGLTETSYNTPLLIGPVTLFIELNYPVLTYLVIHLSGLWPNSDARPLFLQDVSEDLVNLFVKFPGIAQSAQLLTQFLDSTTQLLSQVMPLANKDILPAPAPVPNTASSLERRAVPLELCLCLSWLCQASHHSPFPRIWWTGIWPSLTMSQVKKNSKLLIKAVRNW